MKTKTKWHLIGDPAVRQKIAFWFRCAVYAFALIGFGDILARVIIILAR